MSEPKKKGAKQSTKKLVYVLAHRTKCRGFVFAQGAKFEATEDEIKELNGGETPQVKVL